MFLYKKTHTVSASRTTSTTDKLDLSLDGKVRDGTVVVEAFYEIPPSFQQGTNAVAKRRIFDETYFQGEAIALDKSLRAGKGKYTVRITYEHASGLFRLELPDNNTL